MQSSFNLNFKEGDLSDPSSRFENNLDLKILADTIGKSDLKGNLTTISVDDCVPYKNHIFAIGDVEALTEDIKENGVMHPIIVRPTSDGKNEVISGHRRLEASRLAGLSEIQAIIINVNDDEAEQMMVNANLLQRPYFSKGELARAYKIRAKYFLHQGKQNGEQTYIRFAKEMGKSASYAKRILYLSKLSDDLLILIDEKMIGATAAESLRNLTDAQMNELVRLIRENNRVLTSTEIQLIAGLKKHQSVYEIWTALPASPVKSHRRHRISFSIKPYWPFIPEEYSDEEICKTISDALDAYFNVSKA